MRNNFKTLINVYEWSYAACYEALHMARFEKTQFSALRNY